MTGMADQESEVELLQDLGWDDGWISSFGFSSIRERCPVETVGMAVHESIRPVHFTICPIGSNPLLDRLSTE